MASYKNSKDNVIHVTENIIITLSDDQHGEMYVYDDKYRYVLNGMTASDLIWFFYDENNCELSEEIQDTMMSLTINEETH